VSHKPEQSQTTKLRKRKPLGCFGFSYFRGFVFWWERHL
jgi:hypothetical protein